MEDFSADNSHLRFMTGEGKNPHRKANLFCAFHPDDRAIALEIMQTLIRVCDCTVFYYPNGGRAWFQDQVVNVLNETSLFILVVSSNYLFSDSFARDMIYPYAVQHRIPVLPIVTETGLEEPFSRQLGNVQYLLLNGERYDSTAVPYVEKLKNHLSQAVCSEISTETFHSAFDAGIFLSYRKKDRQYAQSLIQMIHSDERCHGIAIWYDEFLIPGEDFNHNIRLELEDSTLMVLVVTPHINEKNNYIMLTEYPAALAIGKTVLPFEMCQTSRVELDQQYPQLPELIPAVENSAVRDVILRSIEKLGIQQIATTAEKEYIRAVAYLKGIRVEKNTEIGVSKMRFAAEAGVAPAMQTLAFMYKSGEGVPISVQDAATWQARYIQTLSDDSVEAAQQLSQAYFELAELHEQALRYPAAIEAYRCIAHLCQKEELQHTPTFMEYHAMAMLKAGSLYMQQGDYSIAKLKCLDVALRIRQQQYELQPSMLQEVKMCELYALLAQCCELYQNRPEAKNYTILLKNMLPPVAEIDTIQADSYSLIERILTCNNKLGHLLITLFEYHSHDAFIYIGHSVIIAQKLVEISDCYASRCQLILAHMNDGDQHAGKKSENHLMVAKSAYDDAYAEAVYVTEHYGATLEVQRMIAKIQQKQGYVTLFLANAENAAERYEQAIAQFRQNYALFASPATRKELYDCLLEACTVYEQQKASPDRIEAILTEALALTKENAASQLAAYQKDAAAAHALLADLYKKQWDMDRAFEHTVSQLDFLRNVTARTGRIADIRAFATALNKALTIAKLAGEFEAHNKLRAELTVLLSKYDYI